MSRLIEVELFWDGDGYYYANVGSSDRLGGPIIKLHDAWKQADSEGFEVVAYRNTRGLRHYKKVPIVKSTAQKEKDFKKYMDSVESRDTRIKKT